MSIHLSDPKLSIFIVPKCGSTTLKQFALALHEDRQQLGGTGEARARFDNLHDRIVTKSFTDTVSEVVSGALKVAVLRDPIKRVLSFYANRIVHGRILDDKTVGAGFLRLNRLSGRPSLRQFLAHLEDYIRADSRTRNHTQPLSTYLGRNPEFFDKLVPVHRMGELNDWLRDKFGPIPSFDRLKTEGPKIDEADLLPGEVKKLRAMYKEDYQIFGPYMA